MLVSYFIFSAIAIHFLRSDLYFTYHPLSLFAVGDFGNILKVGLFTMGMAEILLVFGIFNTPSKISVITASFLLISAVGVMLVAFFPMDTDEYQTTTGMIHLTGASLQFFFFPPAVFLFSFLPVNSAMKFYSKLTGISTWIFLMIITAILIKDIAGEIKIYGLIQKINILFISTWILLTGKNIEQIKL